MIRFLHDVERFQKLSVKILLVPHNRQDERLEVDTALRLFRKLMPILKRKQGGVPQRIVEVDPAILASFDGLGPRSSFFALHILPKLLTLERKYCPGLKNAAL